MGNSLLILQTLRSLIPPPKELDPELACWSNKTVAAAGQSLDKDLKTVCRGSMISPQLALQEGGNGLQDGDTQAHGDMHTLGQGSSYLWFM
jgi:hypothetical protein